MRALLWGGRILIFAFVLAFSLKNTETVSVGFFFDRVWNAPLIVVVLAFFAGGAVVGLLSLAGTIFGLKREVKKLKRELIQPKQIPPANP